MSKEQRLGDFEASMESSEFATPPEVAQGAGRITVFEALAEETDMVGLSRSNMTTPPAADADDQ
ncbi:MAG TPA: hypothetical protein VM535_00600 [Candidatus Saccharimonadales bacterium]|nr:hypothetical protein [Candidatus Saccharimonadales bacterium]